MQVEPAAKPAVESQLCQRHVDLSRHDEQLSAYDAVRKVSLAALDP
jgi:hypothetical protein